MQEEMKRRREEEWEEERYIEELDAQIEKETGFLFVE